MQFAGQGIAALVARVVFALLVLAFGAIAPAHAQDAVCAVVKIEIKQKLSLERQAFDAVMRINNGLDTASITNIGVNLTFQDQAGNAVVASSDSSNTSATFFVRVDSLNGITGIDGTGTVGPKATGEIHWLIIPAPGAGGILPQGKLYFVGASLTYTLLGNTTTLPVTPDFITVKPQPLLALDYFLAGDVYADDPFTPAVEPAEPFTLGLRIKNVGGGAAAKVSIESAQPKIVENKQGLLIGFQILDSYVNDQPANKTLLIDFGDIPPGTSAVGRWNMVTTLSGKFIDLVAGYTHADSLGGALTSLIQGVTTHLLVHDVKADLPGRDNVRDFLALDGSVLRLYESEGTDTAVIDQSVNARLVSSFGAYDLTFPPTTGFAYVKLADPFAGQKPPGAVVRSDGKTLPPENVWLSKTRNANLTWSYYVNFFDVNTTGIYKVGFTAGTLATLSGVVYADANNNGSKDAGENGLGVTAVTMTGVDEQGAPVDTTAYAAPDGSWSFVQKPGTYSLKVAAVAGYVDGKHKIGTAGGAIAGDTISGIVLGANAQATGYLFAKVAVGPPPPTQADLSLTMTASATTAQVGDSVTFTIKVSNAGPAAATVAKVTDVLPAALTLVSAAGTVGTYDGVTGLWSIGNLASAASATLTLVAKVNSVAAPVVNTAAASASQTDPDLANNTATVTLNPNAGTLKVTQSIPREARVLAFVGCPGVAAGANPTCTNGRSSFLGGYLRGQGYDTAVVTDLDAFTNAFRSGRYNTYWLSADDAMSTLLMSEVREAVRRGDTLIFDGPTGSTTAPLDEVTGINSQPASVGTNLPIAVVGGASAAAVGDDRKIQVKSGNVRATFGTRQAEPAIVSQSLGRGFGIVAAFDLLGTLQQAASEVALHPLIVETLSTNAPQVPASFVGDAYVPITTAIENLAADAIVEVTTTLPPGVTLVDTLPAPTSVVGADATWRFALPAKTTRYVDLGVRVPVASGSYSIPTLVSKIQGVDPVPFGTYNVVLPVTAADQFGPQLITDLLNLTGVPKARDTAVASLQAAQGEIAGNRFANAFASFIAASDALGSITSISPLAYQLTVDKWLQEAEQRWYLGLPVCGAAAVAPLPTAGTGFAPFDANEGLAVRGGRARNKLDWAWSLGADRTSGAKSVQQELDWVTGRTYSWQLNYDGLGAGSYTVIASGVPLFSKSYSGTGGKLDAGNILELRVNALPEAGAGKIEASVQSLNGKPIVGALSATGLQAGASALYLYYPPMTSGFQLAGTVRLTFPVPDSLLGDQLLFTVTSGSSLCRQP
jgi:uncharacterized repeat protein (TIGR01451 family)